MPVSPRLAAKDVLEQSVVAKKLKSHAQFLYLDFIVSARFFFKFGLLRV